MKTILFLIFQVINFIAMLLLAGLGLWLFYIGSPIEGAMCITWFLIVRLLFQNERAHMHAYADMCELKSRIDDINNKLSKDNREQVSELDEAKPHKKDYDLAQEWI